jgi:hypothetical protein
MGVTQTGQDETAVQVNSFCFLARQGQDVSITANGRNSIAANSHCLSPGQIFINGKNLGMVQNKVSGSQLFLLCNAIW